MPRRPHLRHRPRPTFPQAIEAPVRHSCEAESTPGLEEFAREELAARFGQRALLGPGAKPGLIPFAYEGGPRDLLDLGTVGAVYLVRRLDVPRPLALLGHQHFEALVGMIETARGLHPTGAFRTFRISAAGEGSPAYERLRGEIAKRTGLAPDSDGGDLLLRVRRPVGGGEGFEVSVRLSPRPLSARPWRVCDMPGALNGPAARVLASLTHPRPDDRFLNVACGSGTLLVERLALGPAREAIGADTSAEALACARTNIEAAGLAGRVRLEGWDAGELPLPNGAMTALCADLPFGHLLGSHAANERLYPRLLADCGRVAAPGARFALITSEARLTERVLADQSALWTTERTIRLSLDGVALRIYVLVRRGTGI